MPPPPRPAPRKGREGGPGKWEISHHLRIFSEATFSLPARSEADYRAAALDEIRGQHRASCAENGRQKRAPVPRSNRAFGRLVVPCRLHSPSLSSLPGGLSR